MKRLMSSLHKSELLDETKKEHRTSFPEPSLQSLLEQKPHNCLDYHVRGRFEHCAEVLLILLKELELCTFFLSNRTERPS